MKKPLPAAVIVTVAVLAIVAIGFMIVKGSGDPEPTVKDAPDYSKMSPEEINAAFQKSKQAEQDALKQAGRTSR